MIDLHAHILPGVDDGAKTIEDTIEMARAAAEGGTKLILATPHRKDITENWSVSYVGDLLDEANRMIRDRGIPLALGFGMENHLGLDLPDEVTGGRALHMGKSRYILVEMPFFGKPNYVEDILFQLQLQGLTPVLAHPERIEAFQNDPEMLVKFVERGMLSQITAGSIVGHFGKRVQRFTHTLLKRRLVHVIASDTHYAKGPRSPRLEHGVTEAASIVGQEKVHTMVIDTPQAILEDRPVKLEPPTGPLRTRRWWRF